MPDSRIYLDNAATSWPKPDAVYRAVERYQRQLGAPAGRSAYDEAAQVQEQVGACRRRLARLINAEDPSRIVFMFNGTDALNQAIHGVLRPGDHVVTTVAEHNSILRPLRFLQERGQIEVAYAACNDEGVVLPESIRTQLRPNTRLVACTHASNVTGALQPIEEIVHIARQHAALMLVDAAQSLGHVPIDVRQLPVDLLAAPGHKGLLGPLGTGLLYIRPGIEEHVEPIRQGGTGTESQDDRQPSTLPERYESGNLNVLGLAGLAEGVQYLLERGIGSVRQHEIALTERLMSALDGVEGVRLAGPRQPSQRVGVVSISYAGFDPQEVAAMLEATYRIQVRAGLHCAPRMHQALGTLDQGGTVRFSIGPFNTEEDIDAAIRAVRELAESQLSI